MTPRTRGDCLLPAVLCADAHCLDHGDGCKGCTRCDPQAESAGVLELSWLRFDVEGDEEMGL